MQSNSPTMYVQYYRSRLCNTGGTKVSVPPVILSIDYNESEMILFSACKRDFNARYFPER